MNTSCVTGCGAPGHGYYLCATCTGELVRDLRRVAELADELTTTTSRQARTGDRVGASRPADQPLPIHLAAASAAHTLTGVLSTWARDIAGRTGSPLDVRDAATAAAWLLRHVPTIRTHPAADELHADITSASAHAWRVVDRPTERRFVGPCDECGTDLHARPHAADVRCRYCGAVYDAEARRAWLLDQARDQLATASEIARALPGLLGHEVTPAMIRGYVHRGRLLARPPDAAGRARFRVGDVIEVVMST